MSAVERAYYGAPPTLQHVMVSAMGAQLHRQRYGAGWRDQQRVLESLAGAGRVELERHQLAALHRVLTLAVEHVPHYRAIGRVPALRSIADWHAVRDDIPLVGKDEIRERPDDFVAPAAVAPGRRFVLSTSGTTGTPLRITSTYEARQRHYAFWSRLRSWYGVGGRDVRATFFGRVVASVDQDEPPFWRYDWPQRNMLFSSYHLDDRHLPAYYERLRRLAPAEIIGYPSSLSVLARFINGNRLRPLRPKVVFATAETLLDHQRDEIRTAFTAPLVNQYGCTEMVVFAAECREATMHVHPEHGLLEVVDERGRAVGADEPGEAVCTGFLNDAMPLVRYRLGDRIALSDRPCPCGSPFPVVAALEGRVDDVLVTPSGRPIPRLDPVFKGMRGIRETQIVQTAADAIVIKVCADPSFTTADARRLVDEATQRVGPEVQVRVEPVAAIPRQANGKFRSVVRLPSAPRATAGVASPVGTEVER